MARIAFEKIMAGLEDSLAYVDGDSSRCTAHQLKVADVDITHLREKLGLSQDRFAALFGLSSRTVRNWEQGVRQPSRTSACIFKTSTKSRSWYGRQLSRNP